MRNMATCFGIVTTGVVTLVLFCISRFMVPRLMFFWFGIMNGCRDERVPDAGCHLVKVVRRLFILSMFSYFDAATTSVATFVVGVLAQFNMALLVSYARWTSRRWASLSVC